MNNLSQMSALMINKSITHKVFILCGLLLLLMACDTKQPKQTKEFQEDGTITIGVAWPQGRGLFVQGAQLAVQEVNEAGGLLGQAVELVIDEREEALYEALETTSILTAGEGIKEYSRIVARDFSYHNKQVVAVTGHQYSASAFSAAQIYQQNQKVFIAPTATNVLLTTMNFDYVYRMLPTNIELGHQLSQFAGHKGFKRVAVFNERSEGALELSEAFSQAAEENYGIHTAIQRSFFSDMSEREFTDYAVSFVRAHRKNPLDAIFLFTDTTLAIQIIREFKKRGLDDVLFVGGENLDNQTFWEKLSKLQQNEDSQINISVPTVFNLPSQLNNTFVSKFERHYQQAPDRFATLGYDSINVILRAIKRAGTSEPSKIADEVRYSPTCRGLTGTVGFQDNGDVSGKTYIIKSFMNGRFEYRTLKDKAVSEPRAKSLKLCVELDSDDDGVVNKLDVCPNNTKLQLSKGIYLEGDSQGCPIESDKDGVPDYRDQCPNDGKETLVKGVNEQGCPKDTDDDSIPDYRDKAPNNTREAISAGVDNEGIPLDSDSDNTPDYLDHCPNDSTKAQSKGLDIHGCPNDADQDKVPDYQDLCPNDEKRALSKGVNANGCPIDTDSDNIPDYLDACPLSGKHEKAGGLDAKGCPVDNDNDGVANYRDNCPDNAQNELRFGVDAVGCPIDSDKDNVPDHADYCRMNTQKELAKGVDASGCPLDHDKDGIIDVLDTCHDTSAESQVYGIDAQGCPVDSDEDGLEDYLDKCPNTPVGVQVTPDGCTTLYVHELFAENFDRKYRIIDEAKLSLTTFMQRFDHSLIYDAQIIVNTSDEQANDNEYINALADFLIANGIAKTKIVTRYSDMSKGSTLVQSSVIKLEVRMQPLRERPISGGN
ncbi:hypothetical protein BET10_14010 [Pseudoalteromonas amylolytica]|uniref:Leucine-binding protein domain-containing protein n=2 Tax=Pseudoalteromonas TaxID=53246 RepID=A0A1S1MTD2_9GAMM|nr:hypothetical protein BFC16_20965 [Pseudoalteromonas sp. JW3]OHU89904.1 hypothetical protein BET10_14010 [Pseudoalteromonas amylolytica]